MLLTGARYASAQLPAPTNPNLTRFGYYFVNEKNGDDTGSVWAYTNIYVAIPDNVVVSEATFSEWQSAFDAQLNKATFNHKPIYLVMTECGITVFNCASYVTWDNILDVARNYWGQIAWVEVAHEKSRTLADMDWRVSLYNGKAGARGLPGRSLGATISPDDILTTDAIYSSGLSWVDIEAYEPCDVTDCSRQNWDTTSLVSDLNNYLYQAKSRVAWTAGKQIFLTGQAYDRLYWTNMTTLEALQRPVYLNAYNDSSVIGILMFAYNRSGGTKDHPVLKPAHCEIAAAMSIGPGCSFTIRTGGSVINAGSSVASPNGRFVLAYQTDGNLVLYDYGTAIWAINCWYGCSSTGLWGNPYAPGGNATIQTDGNLVTYNAYGQPTFASWTQGNPSAYLAIGDDGSLRVLSPTGSVLWTR
jgi:hypothetical protein